MPNDILNSPEYEILRSTIDTSIKSHYSEKEEELKNILKSLYDLGYLKESHIQQLQEDLAQELYNALMIEMLSAFSEDDANNLINAIQTGLNEAQTVELFLRLYSKNTGKELELYAVEVIEGFTQQLIDQLKMINQTIEDVQNLTDEQASVVIDLIDQGMFSEAETKLAEFNSGLPTEASTSSVQDLPKEDLCL